MNDIVNEIKSERGKMIKTVVEENMKNRIFSYNEAYKNDLQDVLNEKLDFETKVFDINIKDNSRFGKISFTDENNTQRIIDWVVTVNEMYGRFYHDDSILVYDKICDHDSGYFCECRKKWLLEFLDENITLTDKPFDRFEKWEND